jgi:hypothetical protein
MRFGKCLLSSSLLLATCIPGFAMTHSRRGPTSPKLFNKRASTKAAKPTSQRAIDDTRATAIQTALIKQGYLSGEASGHWDGQTEAAMQKMQSDNGWQTKLVPDSRAIIKLGLGPNHDAEQASVAGGETSTQ